MQSHLSRLQRRCREGLHPAMLTCYEAGMARALETAGVDAILVGDSLGMVVQGQAHTLAVTLEDMVYHTRCVARGAPATFIIADLPFGSYQTGAERAFDSSRALLAAGAHMVKLEGGSSMVDTVRWLVERGVPVCGHLGLQPQSVHLTGYRRQGDDDSSARRIREEAHLLADAGAGLLVLESIPAPLAAAITAELSIPTIGIGAGPHTTGQVLVLHDVLGIWPDPPPFSRNFLADSGSIPAALSSYVHSVHQGQFPPAEDVA